MTNEEKNKIIDQLNEISRRILFLKITKRINQNSKIDLKSLKITYSKQLKMFCNANKGVDK